MCPEVTEANKTRGWRGILLYRNLDTVTVRHRQNAAEMKLRVDKWANLELSATVFSEHLHTHYHH